MELQRTPQAERKDQVALDRGIRGLQSAFSNSEADLCQSLTFLRICFSRWVETDQLPANLLKLTWVLSSSVYAAMDTKLSAFSFSWCAEFYGLEPSK